MNEEEVLIIAGALRRQKDFNLAVIGTLIELVKLVEKPDKHTLVVNKIETVLNMNSEFFKVVNMLPYPEESVE